MVSVDVKHHVYLLTYPLPLPKEDKRKKEKKPELRCWFKVEVAVLGFLSLIVRTVSVWIKATLNLNQNNPVVHRF